MNISESQMELKHNYGGSVCGTLLPLSGKYPWFVTQNLEVEKDSSIFYTIHDPLIKYQCQIPELLGKHIRGYFHGWVILSCHPQNVMWSLWNPVTFKIIRLPHLILKDGDLESIAQCCLSAPPDDPTSILMLTRTNKTTFVFCLLGNKRKKRRWIEMSYAKQLKRITGEDNLFINSLVCCNGKVYALNVYNSFAGLVILIDIAVKDKEVLIKLVLLGASPFSSSIKYSERTFILKGSCTDLFLIELGFNKETLERVHLFRLDMTSVKSEEMERFTDLDMTSKNWKELEDYTDFDMSFDIWEEMVDLNDAIFFVDLARDNSVYYKPEIASKCLCVYVFYIIHIFQQLGGYIHIRDRSGKLLYTYHFKDKTISLSCMPSMVQPTSNVSLWECRLEDGHGEVICTTDSKQEEDQILVKSFGENAVEFNECHLLNLPLEILETIIKHCVGVEYMNFCATCKRCHVAAPLIQWSNETSLRRLQTYSLISPWLTVVDNNKGIITFTDPMFGESYFMKNQHVWLGYQEVCCSRFGWLLFSSTEFGRLVFFKPFIGDLRKLPLADCSFESVCFSAPPTSPNCMVVGFSTNVESHAYIHYVAWEQSWCTLGVGFEPYSIHFPTFLGQDLYALRAEGELISINVLGEEDYSPTFVEAKAPLSCCRSPSHYYLMRCDQDLLEVIVAAPLIQWSNETSLRRLQTYSLISPWLMVVDNNKSIITFTDPMFGESYFMKNQHVWLGYQEVCCSRFGWLLFSSTEFGRLVFFNPFTGDLRKLPLADCSFESVSFSAPPTSPNCMVVGFSTNVESHAYIHYVAREQSWRTLGVGFEPYSIHFPTFLGQDLYALRAEGELISINVLGEEDYSPTFVEAKAPLSCCRSPSHYYLMRCDQDLLEVIVGETGVPIEVFKRNDSKHEWKKIHSLGKYMIYICDTICLCIEAKTPQMENKIYFPRRHPKNRKIVFYSLDTNTYHTFIRENIEQQFKDYMGTAYHLVPHAWIEPSW
ncbi:hypothetical protein CTI12_AA572200 [Artemisia annua]|uniref:F-box domain-containing protein n=1 Tax=Artemisia annua TaxID=35608 RepID=A0A2U1KRW4_ARTAN|nr:hypothetical protein CTI12_AA572200 [Artemisia annua]